MDKETDNVFGIKEVVVKSNEDKAYLASLRDEEKIYGAAISQQFIERLDRRFGRQTYPEPVTKKEKKKAKKREKSFRNIRVTNINRRRLFTLLVVFFALALIGAIVSWSVMAGKNISLAGKFDCTIIERVLVPDGHGGAHFEDNIIKDEEAQERAFAKKSGSDFGLVKEVKLVPNEKIVGTKIYTFTFKVQARGSGEANVRIELWDASVAKSSALSKDLTLKSGKAKKVTVRIDHNFTSLNSGNYIKIIIPPGQIDSEIDGITIFDIRAQKA